MKEITKWKHKDGFGDITDYLFLAEDGNIYLKLQSGDVVEAAKEHFYLANIEQWVKDGTYTVVE